jgi:glutathione S-transferase
MLIRAAWPLIRRRMIAGMDLGYRQGQQSTNIADEQLRWLDTLLADGRQFLVGEQLSRADITAASLFSPLASPREHPSYQTLSLPPRFASQIQEWNDRRSLSWIRGLYRQYR